MNRLVIAFVCALAFSSAASAQTSAWSSPTGRYTFNYEADGWTPIANFPSDDGDVLGIEHQGFQAADHGALRMCAVQEKPLPNNNGLTQDSVNAALSARSDGDLSSDSNTSLHDIARSQNGGVLVLSFWVELNGLRQYWRMFYLAAPDAVTQVNIACGGATPLNDAEVGNIAHVLNSLVITPR